jgi:hypothetical protein
VREARNQKLELLKSENCPHLAHFNNLSSRKFFSFFKLKYFWNGFCGCGESLMREGAWNIFYLNLFESSNVDLNFFLNIFILEILE